MLFIFEDSWLSGGAIGGIIVSALVVGLVVDCVGILMCREGKKKSETAQFDYEWRGLWKVLYVFQINAADNRALQRLYSPLADVMA